jgi:hypothetical protein
LESRLNEQGIRNGKYAGAALFQLQSNHWQDAQRRSNRERNSRLAWLAFKPATHILMFCKIRHRLRPAAAGLISGTQGGR